MSDNITANFTARPGETITHIEDMRSDSAIYMVTGNNEQGLSVNIVDVRKVVPEAFPPRAAVPRYVTETAALYAELSRRPLLEKRSTVWANRNTGTVTVVYNDLDPDADADYTRRNDCLTLKFVADPDWSALFKAADGQFHQQEEFGDLIEAAGHLITSHPTAELMEIVDTIRASSKGAFESRIRRDTGAQHLSYTEEVTTRAGSATKLIEVPREITLTARPFEDYPEIAITCWLRLRINSGQLLLGLFPQPYQHHVRDAWNNVIGEIETAIGVPVYVNNTAN